MKYGSLIIEKGEFVLLKQMMSLTGYYKDNTLGKSAKKLAEEMQVAKIVDGKEMPVDVIRFNTTVTIVSDGGWHKKFKLVLPKHGDVQKGKISILTPMGAAVMGYAQGDLITWEFPSGYQNLTIEKVEQENESFNYSLLS